MIAKIYKHNIRELIHKKQILTFPKGDMAIANGRVLQYTTFIQTEKQFGNNGIELHFTKFMQQSLQSISPSSGRYFLLKCICNIPTTQVFTSLDRKQISFL